MNTATSEESSKPRGLTLEDAFICIDKTSWLQSRAYMQADARDAGVMCRVAKRDGSAAFMHIVDRATQGMDDGEALEIYNSRATGESIESFVAYLDDMDEVRS